MCGRGEKERSRRSVRDFKRRGGEERGRGSGRNRRLSWRRRRSRGGGSRSDQRLGGAKWYRGAECGSSLSGEAALFSSNQRLDAWGQQYQR